MKTDREFLDDIYEKARVIKKSDTSFHSPSPMRDYHQFNPFSSVNRRALGIVIPMTIMVVLIGMRWVPRVANDASKVNHGSRMIRVHDGDVDLGNMDDIVQINISDEAGVRVLKIDQIYRLTTPKEKLLESINEYEFSTDKGSLLILNKNAVFDVYAWDEIQQEFINDKGQSIQPDALTNP